ncbi:hypothetical protein BKA69DRAFT_1031845 [Paraphysoderma sedebokerense]|nr:hypothetical protein BKA69DRAFT_1031845 [Paraphysoderma sedebokerense]
MFTGIVEHIGTITSISTHDVTSPGGESETGWTVTIGDAGKVLVDCNEGDSISVNGTCLTVTEFTKDIFKVGLAPETLRRTNLGKLKVGDKVNLERAMSGSTRFGGHFVQGHVDCTGTLTNMKPEQNSLWLTITVPSSYIRYIIPKGYITLDGTSLTVCTVDPVKSCFTVMLISYTQQHVILPLKKVGDEVNVEVDMVGKYVENCISGLAVEGGPLENVVERIVERMWAKKSGN